MPQYFLTVPHDSADEPPMESMQEMDPADLERLMAETTKLNNDLTESKVLVHAGGLHPPSSAIMVDATSTPPTHTPDRSSRRISTSVASGSSTSPTRRRHSSGRSVAPPPSEVPSRSEPSKNRRSETVYEQPVSTA